VTTGRRRPSVRQRVALRGAQDRPVFVGGCPRSGTTLFGSMLHSHPMLAMPPETRFVVDAYKRQQEFGNLRDEAARRAAAEWIVRTKSTRFRQLGLDPQTVVDVVTQAPPTIGSVTGTVLAQFAAAHGKSRWGDKRPKHVEHLPMIFRMFPDAQFIHLIRDARGCTASLKQLGWWGWGAVESLHRWQQAVEAGIEARELCRPDQYLELRYEDLVADPTAELQRVCDFLGVSFVEEMLGHESGAALIDKKYHGRVSQPVDDTAVLKWRTILTPEELALVEAKVGVLLDEFDYPRLGDLPPVPAEMSASYDERALARSPAVKQRRIGVDPMRYIGGVAARLTTGQRRLARGRFLPLGAGMPFRGAAHLLRRSPETRW
jgi:Sulfotransferase family